ncbi:MAG: phosphoglycolate phosphatase [Bryobacterales bacterium]|nr:phosphoglycolate phosphatase [Bryobacterales bacterium]
MRYLALASDYDGTLAHHGVVDDHSIQALERLVHSGRSLILVTGRELPDLESVFPRLDLCERVVAENGALLYNPATREKRTLAQRPPQSFLDNLRHRGVSNVSAGEVIVATWHPYETQVVEAIRDSSLELQIIFNKDAVMILPSGVNKMTGLCAALKELKLSPHNVVGIGDAENDHAFLDSCECSVAVANAIPALKERAAFVTRGDHGAGVVEIIDKLIANDLSDLDARLKGEPILIGEADGRPVTLARYGRNVLVCGQSGSGKSMLVTGLLERIIAMTYQICLVDPEGDYENLADCLTVGDAKHPPPMREVMQVLSEPEAQVIVNLVGVTATDQPECFASMITEIQQLRIRTGRPHWLVIDEAHHVLPSDWAPSSAELAGQLSNVMLVTVHPGHVSPIALSRINTVIVVGRETGTLLQEFAEAAGLTVPEVPGHDLESGEALIWFCDENRLIARVKLEPSHGEHSRHRRKYAEGELEPERIFYFRGPQGESNLRANNLNSFVQLAEGVDPKTWLFHLKRGDYSNWFRHALKDAQIANEIESIEKDERLPEKESRQRIKDVILQKYTAPA